RTRNKGVTSNDYSVGVAATWEIDFFGRLRSLSDAALEQYFATAYARQAAEILLVSQVADQYLAMLALNEQLAVTRRTLETAQASYKIVKLQFDTGTAAELTLRQSETVVEQANANDAALVRARAQAENGLVLLIGQPLPADLPPMLPMGEQKILADIPAGLPSDLLARRPDILQAEALLRSENADIGADTYLNVLTAQTDFYSAQLALVSTRLQRLTSLVDLYRSLGGGWIERTGDQPRPADDALAVAR